MKRIYFTISIDTEPDSSGDSWNYRDPLSFQGVTVGIGEILTPLFQKYGMRPTYLLNNVILEYGPMDFLKSLPDCELGTHLHPDFMDPDKICEPAGHDGKSNLCFLDPAIAEQKIKAITALFQEKTGRKPTAFRAGRWSANGAVVKVLSELGYAADVSVTPGIRWADATRLKPVDYRFAPRQPYHPSAKNLCRKGKLPILEIPVAVCGYYPFRRTWVRPAWFGVTDLVRTAEKYLRQFFLRDEIVLNCMFHDIDLVPDAGPHCKNPAKQKIFLQELEKLLQFMKSLDAEMPTVSELAEKMRRAQ